MYKVPISKIKIESKLAIIRESILELEKIRERYLKSFGFSEQFITDKNQFAIAEHYLRRALESVFDIGGHIISRFSYSPARRPKTFKEIAFELGEKGVVDKKFAKDKLMEMAGYRNRLVHFYDEITAKELYQIIKKDLRDLEIFAQSVIKIIKNSKSVGLEISD